MEKQPSNFDLDKRLAVLEQLSVERNRTSSQEHQYIVHELREIRKDLSNLKTKTAGAAAVVAALVAFFAHLIH